MNKKLVNIILTVTLAINMYGCYTGKVKITLGDYVLIDHDYDRINQDINK